MPPSDPHGQDSAIVVRANELYWESTKSVNRIAEELGLSKGRLYEAVRPLESGRPCPRCGAGLVFQNRTARDRELVVCPACELEEELSALQPEESEESLWVGSVDVPLGEREIPPSSRRVLGGVLLGAAAGALIVGFLWRRVSG